jgi:hypothetical protein
VDKIDQAFWQLFHAVNAAVSDEALLEKLPDSTTDGAVTLNLNAPPHAVGVLRREAERRGVDYPALIGALSEERRDELPGWWMMIARRNDVGVLMSSS